MLALVRWIGLVARIVVVWAKRCFRLVILVELAEAPSLIPHGIELDPVHAIKDERGAGPILPRARHILHTHLCEAGRTHDLVLVAPAP